MNKRIEDIQLFKEETVTELRRENAELQVSTTKLMEENRKIKSHVHMSEITKPDGTVEKVYDSRRSVESEKKVVEHSLTIQKMTYEYMLEQRKWESERKLLIETRPSTHVSFGITQSGTEYISATFNIYGIWNIGGWVKGIKETEVGLGVGVAL